MPNAARKVTGQTGSTCSESGPYRSTGIAKVVVFVKKGDTFPPGPDGSPTTWVMEMAAARQ